MKKIITVLLLVFLSGHAVFAQADRFRDSIKFLPHALTEKFAQELKPLCSCTDNIVKDGSFFTVKTFPLNSNISPLSPVWKPGFPDPEWNPRDGCCDKGYVSMKGNKGFGESIRQNGIIITAGKKYSISFCARIQLPSKENFPYVRFRFRAFNGPGNNPTPYSSTANVIGISNDITNTAWVTYTLPDWTAGANFNSIEINPENNNLQQSWKYTSLGEIDNVCIREVPTGCCECGNWSPITIGSQKTYKCGSKLQWGCGKEFPFSIAYACKQKECRSIISYSISLNNQVLKRGTGINSISEAFTPSANGIYTISFEAECGMNRCKPCSLQVEVTGCSTSCCPLSLNFINKPGNPNSYSKIRVSAIGGSQIINSDPDDWDEQRSYPASVTWNAPGTAIPSGEPIDNDFMIYLAAGPSIQKLKIEWLDNNGAVTSIQEIAVPCGAKFAEDEDWTKYVTKLVAPDNNISVFAAKEEDEDDCGMEAMVFKVQSCPFTTSVQCVGNVPTITMTGPPGFVEYNWTVDINNSVSSYTGSSFSIPAPVAGEYKISMQVINGTDTCYYQDGVIISNIDPDFSYKKDACTLKENFTASGWNDPSDIQSVTWQCNAVSGFPSTGQNTATATYTFAQEGIYNVTMTITDKYGCTKTITKAVIVTSKCTPSFEQHFTFCPDSCYKDTKMLYVRFDNTSSGGICPVTYTWNFGDGSAPVVDNAASVTHGYMVNCTTGKSFNITLTMSDANPAGPCKAVFTKQVNVKPCKYDFTYEACPDGRVNFKEINGKFGEWSFPGSHSVAPWPYSDWKKKKSGHWVQSNVVVRYDATGDYLVQFHGYDDEGCECIVSKYIHVELDCCRKNQVARSTDYFSANGKNYKVKSKLAARQYPLYHRLNSVTKLRKRKKLGNTSITYWGISRADQIQATINGKMYKRDAASHCNCKTAQNVNDSESRSSRSKAHCSHQTNGKFRLRLGTSPADRVQSTHTVTIGTTTQTYGLELPKTNNCSNPNTSSSDCCTPFRWYFDWF